MSQTPVTLTSEISLREAFSKRSSQILKNIRISGVVLYWHEVEGILHENMEKPTFHIKGQEAFMENARPQGQQYNTDPIRVDWEHAKWGVAGHDQRFFTHLLYSAAYHEDYLRNTAWVIDEEIEQLFQTRLLRKNSLNRSCDNMQATIACLRMRLKEQQATGISNDASSVPNSGKLLVEAITQLLTTTPNESSGFDEWPSILKWRKAYMLSILKSEEVQTALETEYSTRQHGRPPYTVLPEDLIPIFPYASISDTDKALYVLSDSWMHIGKNSSRSQSEWQNKMFHDYTEMPIGSFHKNVNFSSGHGAKIQWYVESIEQLVRTKAKDQKPELLEDDVLVICCLTEIFDRTEQS